jgi:hypothetical protein
MICAVERRGGIPSIIRKYWVGSEEGNKKRRGEEVRILSFLYGTKKILELGRIRQTRPPAALSKHNNKHY